MPCSSIQLESGCWRQLAALPPGGGALTTRVPTEPAGLRSAPLCLGGLLTAPQHAPVIAGLGTSSSQRPPVLLSCLTLNVSNGADSRKREEAAPTISQNALTGLPHWRPLTSHIPRRGLGFCLNPSVPAVRAAECAWHATLITVCRANITGPEGHWPVAQVTRGQSGNPFPSVLFSLQ